MLRGATPSAEEMAGTAVLRIVVSSDSIKKATATSHGTSRLAAAEGADEDEGALNRLAGFIYGSAGTEYILSTFCEFRPAADKNTVTVFLRRSPGR
jgi:hypothetical protein